jgi:potassium-transporting ATPase KdpC subunit
MRRDLLSSFLAVVVFTVLLGLAYPLVMTGVAQVTFPNKADGSPIEQHGEVVGSKLLGRAWTTGTGDDARPDPRYFQPRPSATGYAADGSFFSNRGPNSAAATAFYRDALTAYLALERPYDRSLTKAGVPVDAVTTSASGVDPAISTANAAIQAHRVAAVRHLPLPRVQALIASHTDGRSLGVLGEPGVNTTTLNLALDQEATR